MCERIYTERNHVQMTDTKYDLSNIDKERDRGQ